MSNTAVYELTWGDQPLSTVDTLRHVTRELIELEASDDVRAILITGGSMSFDLRPDAAEIAIKHSDARNLAAATERFITALVRCHLPTVAAVHGRAAGTSCTVALAADIIIMGEGAELVDAHVAIGAIAADGAMALWPLLMTLNRARRHLLLGEPIDAVAAATMGLATEVVPDTEVIAAAMRWADRLAALPAHAVQDTKRALNMHVQQAWSAVAPFVVAASAGAVEEEEEQPDV